jgi:small subunit ribosomal protein S3
MGQKVNPVGLRVGVNRDWDSKWYASDKEFATFLHEDIKVREYLEKELKDAALSTVEIQRVKDKVEVNLNVARPGVVVGQDGKRVEEISKQVKKICHGKDVKINVVEVKNPDLDAKLVAQSIAAQLEARASFRTVQKKAIQRVMKAGAKGIKTSVSGRLAGADIARSEGYSEGVVPLHTLRADIDYATAEAHTTYGRLGVKVWICRGEILPTRKPRNNEKGE